MSYPDGDESKRDLAISRVVVGIGMALAVVILSMLGGCAPAVPNVDGVTYVKLYQTDASGEEAPLGSLTAFCIKRGFGIATFVTARHNLPDATSLTVGPHDDPAFVIGASPELDIAVIQCIDRDDYAALPIGGPPKRMEEIRVIGVTSETFLLSRPGCQVRSWIWYTVPGTVVTRDIGRWMGASVMIRRGFSGGPVLRKDGTVCGVVLKSDLPPNYAGLNGAGYPSWINPASANVYFLTSDKLKEFLEFLISL